MNLKTQTPHGLTLIWSDVMTPASIQAAKDATAQERATVYQQTGVVIREDGRITFDRPRMAPASIHAEPCKRCDFVATAGSLGAAVRLLAKHYVTEHRPRSTWADQNGAA